MGDNMDGSAVAEMLNKLQRYCADDKFVGDFAEGLYDCDIIRVDFGETEPPPSHPDLLCDKDSVAAFAEIGDREPYADLPKIVKDYYELNQTPDDTRVEPVYNIGPKYPLFNPLFTGDGDAEEGVLGPLPTISKKLNALGTQMRTQMNITDEGFIETFEDDPKEFEQSTDMSRAPPPNGELRPVQANHHWDVLMRCDPSHLLVTFKIWSRRKGLTEPIFATLSFSFKRVAPRLSFWSPTVDIRTGSAFLTHNVFEMILPVVAVAMFLLLLAPYVLSAIFMFPFNLYRLLTKKGVFKEVIGNILDPIGHRLVYQSWITVLIENLVGAAILFTCTISMLNLFWPYGYLSFYVGFETRVSPFSYWINYHHLGTATIVTQLLFGFWAIPSIHALPLLLLFVRMLEASTFVPGTSFLLMTFGYALMPLLHFLVLFFVIVLAYAAFVHTIYGAEYYQFSTLRHSLWSLMLYSFGFTDQSQAEDGVYPYLERGAYTLQILLLSFQIIVIIILLNMFTTIILDSYTTAVERKNEPKYIESVLLNLWTRMRLFFGYRHQEEDEKPDVEKLGLLESLEGGGGEQPNSQLLAKVKEAMDTLRELQPKLEFIANQEATLLAMVEASESSSVSSSPPLSPKEGVRRRNA